MSNYVGEFLWGNRHRKGTMTYLNRISNYVGEFRWGKKYGQGKHTISDHEKYEGDGNQTVDESVGNFFC